MQSQGTGNRVVGVSWAGTWLLGSGYSGESTMLSSRESSHESLGGTGWRAYSLGVGAGDEAYWARCGGGLAVHFGGTGGVTADQRGTTSSERADCEGDEYYLLVEELFDDDDVARYTKVYASLSRSGASEAAVAD
eukprot:scaffold18557_cov25-Cyclotella_meneghiniana.AAC.6